MSKRFLIAAAFLASLWFAFGSAHAQNTTCPTRPGGDSSNACASTAFVNGSSGNVLPVPAGGTGQSSFTANNPLIGNDAAAIAQGTRSGNTTKFGTTNGTLTNGDCVSIDSNGNLIDAGVTCNGGSGSGTITAGLAGQVAGYNANGTTIVGWTLGPGLTSTSSTLAAGALFYPVYTLRGGL